MCLDLQSMSSHFSVELVAWQNLRHKEVGLGAAAGSLQKPLGDSPLLASAATGFPDTQHTEPQSPHPQVGSQDRSRKVESFRTTVGLSRCSLSFPKSSVAPRAFRSERLSSNREFRGTTCATKRIVSTPRFQSSSIAPCDSWVLWSKSWTSLDVLSRPTRLFSTGFHVALECISSNQRCRTARVWHCAAWAVTDSHDLCDCLVSTVCFLLLRCETFLFLFSHQFFPDWLAGREDLSGCCPLHFTEDSARTGATCRHLDAFFEAGVDKSDQSPDCCDTECGWPVS